MITTYCDLCQEIIKNSDIKYAIVIKKTIEIEPTLDIHEFTERYSEGLDKVEYLEVCEGCKKVLDNLLAMRVKEIKRLKKELENLFKEGNEDEKNS